ncbi:MAG TPA: hypothetical protein VKR31_10525 [Rhizomicrobium sp.]|nr:hypothetical protein [Rhizomicrobium sp.]
MKSVLKLTTAAAALAGTALFCAPASAVIVGVGVGPIGFDVYSGGYCDRWGCPTDYWTYPIYYGPIYYDHAWYRGPVYYRTVNGERWYWVHGAWRRDEWRGARPTWARYYHYGPALGLDYYRTHGFRVRDNDWRAWQDRDYRYRTGYRDYDRGGAYGNEDRYSDRYRDYDNDRDRYGGYDRDGAYDRDMDRDNGYDRDYDRDRGTYEHTGTYDRDRYNGRDQNSPGYDRDRGDDNSGYDRDRGYTGSDRDYDRDDGNGYSSHSMYGHVGHNQAGPDDQTRDHGNSAPTDQSRSENQDGYQHTTYERPGSYGHAKGLPPSSTHDSTHPTTNPDGNNGPSE